MDLINARKIGHIKTVQSSVYRVLILVTYSILIVFFFGLLEVFSFKNEAAVCEITRYHMARFIGFAWSNFASVALGVSAFEPTGIYPFNGNRVPEYCPPFLILI
jgi:hypothetical protein